MSTPIAGALAVTPLYATGADAIVSWDDSGATWRSLGTIPAGGGGTVTSIAAGTGITVSPSPIVGAGTVGLTVPVAVANGGTGSTTVFTAGSVLFAGASGVHAQDNANLFWDDTNNRLGIGTAAPVAPLDIRVAATAGYTTLITVYNPHTSGAPDIFIGDNGGNGVLVGHQNTGAASYGFISYYGTLNPATGGGIILRNNGNVGIGTASPGALLEVNQGSVAGFTQQIKVVNTSATGAPDIFVGDGSGNGLTVGHTNAGGASYGWLSYSGTLNPNVGGGIILRSNGNVGIGTTTVGSLLTANGVCANVSGAWTVISARELKQEIVPYTRSLADLVQLRPVVFRYRAGTQFGKSEDEPSELQIGLLADEVGPVMPELVGETMAQVGKEEIAVATLTPGNALYAVINSIKSLAATNEELAARIAALEAI